MSAAARLLTVLLLICSATLAFGHGSLRQAGEAESSTSSIKSKLPVFFFHGLSSDAPSGVHFQTNLTADGRAFIALTFCQDQCSGIVSGTPAIYKDGYIFMGFSQGALIARAVVGEWDNHNVKTLISLAGPQNGLFYGPQQPDYLALAVLSVYSPKTVDKRVFDFSKFSPADYNGKMQRAAAEAVLYPYLQNQLAIVDMLHPPVSKLWVATNPYLATLNNVNVCDCKNAVCPKAQKRRRANFLKLRTAHFFGSPQGDFVSPWQSSILGQYSEVRTTEQIETLFAQFRVLDVKQTSEYKQDSYELQALDKRGGLFLHAVPNVGHSCWVRDYVTADGGLDCKFQPAYDAHVYPVLRDPLRKSTP